jgi:hypothetical protein
LGKDIVGNFVFAVLEGSFMDALLCIMDVALIKMAMIRKIQNLPYG